MQLIASDQDALSPALAHMLEGYDCPAILVTPEYRILATNTRYRDAFGDIQLEQKPRCYQVSHGYKVPCDQAGEDCPLQAARDSGGRERVLHIHQTPRGPEHVDVEMLPILDAGGKPAFYVEMLRPVPLASGAVDEKEFVGKSKLFNQMLERVARVGSTDASVLLLGESGTGKELAARAIHMASKRKQQPMVTLECAGLSESLFESELFGHVKGAFTGAHSNRKGLVELANAGTLFLDEIGDVPLTMQVKLLRLLESGTFRPVGSTEVRTADFRLICATHKNLAQMVEAGSFRADLYYRINVFPIHLPSLAERMEDIPLLAKTLLARMGGKQKFHLTESAVKRLMAHHYRGNIRELRNILNRALVFADTNVIDGKVIAACLQDEVDSTPAEQTHANRGEPVDLKTNERRYLEELMRFFEGDKGRVARAAGISVRSLYRKLEELND